MKDKKQIENLVNFLSRSMKPDPEALWPIHPFSIEPFFADEFTRKINSVKKAPNSSSLENLANKFINPSRVWKFFPEAIQGAKALELASEERVEIAQFLIDVIRRLKAGNIYCEDRKNIVWSSDTLHQKVSDIDFVSATGDSAQTLGKLHGLIWAYMEALYYQRHNAGKEIHGPYDLSMNPTENRVLIVRDYFDLRPTPLWPEILQDFPIKRVLGYAVYEDVDFEFSLFNEFSNDNSLIDNLTGYHVELQEEGGKLRTVELKELEEKMDRLSNITSKLSQKTNSYTESERGKQHIKNCFYMLQPLGSLIDDGWKPPQHVYDRMDKFGPLSISSPSDPEEAQKQLSRTFDPRNDFLPWKEFYRANLLED